MDENNRDNPPSQPNEDAFATEPVSDETVRFQPNPSSEENGGSDIQDTISIPVVSGEAPVKSTRFPARLLSNFSRRSLVLVGSGAAFALLIIVLAVVFTLGQNSPAELTPDTSATPEDTLPAVLPVETPVLTPSPTIEPTPEETLEPVDPADINPLTGVLLSDSANYSKRPIAVMHNNLQAALPMHGISQADILYEILAEGNITRVVGIYQEFDSIVSLGAVRSTRTYYLELALNHDAVLVHAGASYIAYNDIARWGMQTIDGIKGTFGRYFWRDQTRIKAGVSSEHTLFTSGDNIAEALDKISRQKHNENFAETLQFAFDGTPEDGSTVQKIAVQFLSTKATYFLYDKDTSLFAVEEYNAPMMDGSAKKQVAVTNVLILKAPTSLVPGDKEGRRIVDLSTGGEGYYACGGQYIPIKWNRGSYDGQFTYTLEDDTELKLGAGKSYICIIPTSAPEPSFLTNR